MTSSQHGLYIQGYTHATMVRTVGREAARWSQSPKAYLSSDCRLQLACMKSELLVNAYQHGALNTFPGLVHTARHVTGVGHA
jgi:two-component sensor histidine kinase